MEEHDRIGQPAIELNGTIDIGDVQREPHQGNGHWASSYWLSSLRATSSPPVLPRPIRRRLSAMDLALVQPNPSDASIVYAHMYLPRLAAHLAVFHIGLGGSLGGIQGDSHPLPAVWARDLGLRAP